MPQPRRLAAAFAWSLALACGVASACPKCRVAAGELEAPQLADATGDASSQPAGGATPRRTGTFRGFSGAAGADFPTAYFFRGYLQQDRGIIAQPFITLSADLQPAPDTSIQPYVAWMNTFMAVDNIRQNPSHSGGIGRGLKGRIIEVPPSPENPETTFIRDLVSSAGDGSGWYEAELMAGVTIFQGDWFIDLNYRVHLFPGDDHDIVQEAGGKISYDIARFWDPDTKSAARKLSVRPWVAVYRELSDHNFNQETYMEVGVEPTWRFTAFNRRAAISLPFLLAGSPDGYYVDLDRNAEDLGYASVSLRGSISLPVPEKFGHWYLNGSVTYLRLIADQLERSNRGSENEVTASMGISVSF